MKNISLLLSFTLSISSANAQLKISNKPTEQKSPPQKAAPLSEHKTGSGGNVNSVIASIGANMVTVSGGTFTMGCTSEQGNGCSGDEKPAHSVTVNTFKLSKYEVTQAQWQAVMGKNPSNFTGCDNCPVENVSYDDIIDFIITLNEKTGLKYRLPTEAEWEFAARGGNKSNGYKYSGSNDIEEVAWYAGNSGKKTRADGKLKPNELGLYDMSGNVWEWCKDYYDDKYYSSSSSQNPKGPGIGQYRVLRGGSWGLSDYYCRVAVRVRSSPDLRDGDNGFRLARD